MSDISFACATDVGRVRDHNEDNFCAVPEDGLWVVADGMGGHAAGEVASAIATEHIVSEVGRGTSLCSAVGGAHRAIIAAAHEGRGTLGMGCTVVALRLFGCDFEVAWVGDSRAYLWDGCLQPLTRDHSFVQQLIDSGSITEGEARVHPQRSIITQALGAKDLHQVQVDSVTGRLLKGQSIMLCSDGLTGEVEDEQIAAILQNAGSEEQAVESLISAANDNGGSDNITVVLVSAPEEAPVKLESRKGDTVPIDVTLLKQIARSKRRYRWLLGLLVLLLLVFAVVGGVRWWQRAVNSVAPEPVIGTGCAPFQNEASGVEFTFSRYRFSAFTGAEVG